MLTHRQTTLFPSSGGSPSFGASYLVNALPVGAVCDGATSGTGITVQAGHGFKVGDKLIVGTDTTKFRLVSAVAPTTVTVSATVETADENLLVNLGPDSGTISPNYDGCGPGAGQTGPLIWDEPSDAGTAETNSKVDADATGMYQYWCKGENWWELIRSDATTPVSIVAGVGGGTGRFNIVDFGATLDGSTDDTAADQATIDACGAVGGGEVFIPEGTSCITQLTIDDSNVSVVGAGAEASQF